MKLIYIAIGYICQFLMFIIKVVADFIDGIADTLLNGIDIVLDWCEKHINDEVDNDDNEDEGFRDDN